MICEKSLSPHTYIVGHQTFKLSSMVHRCRVCGLEAHTVDELNLFKKEKVNRKGVTTLCKGCANKQQKEAKRKNIRLYLMYRFHNMRQRCYNPNDPSYHNYGERGITICDDWLNDPDSFVDWGLNNGFKKELWVERIDNNQGYSPANCMWTTPAVQLMNKRTTVTDVKNSTRICAICKEVKQLEEYHKQSRDHAGRRYVCKECRNVVTG